MNRITLEEVQAAYTKHGIKPRRRQLYLLINGQIECCGVGVIAYDAIGAKIAEDCEAMNTLTQKYSREYLIGFACGFDYNCPRSSTAYGKAGFAEGYEDGQNIASVIFRK